MASNPPFELEDINDEDFFDKLVDDDNVDDNVVKANDFVDDANVGPETKNVGANTFLDLSVSEVDHVSVDPERKDSGVNDGSFSGLQSVDAREEHVSDKLTSSLVMSNSFCFENGELLENEVRGSGAEKGSFSFDNGEVVKDEIGVIEGEMGLRRESSGTTSGGGGVKEVQWSAFADSADHGGGFGSYDDFLSDFGQVVVGNVQNEASASAEFGNETIANVATESAYGYNTEVTEQVANVVETNVAGYYENQYPGWQFDHNTGQWYQLDNTGGNGTGQETVEANVGNTQGNVSGSGEGQWDVSDVNSSQVFYSQQNAQTSAATVTTENVSDWNHSLHQNGEFQYPAHMIFDPQYPGWYYDTFAQEWRSLEVYHSSIQSTVHNQHGQDGCSAAFVPDGGTGQGLNDNGIQVSRSENVNANQSYATSLGLYNQQGSNDGQSDFGMNSVSAASYDNGLHVSGSENVNTNQNYGTSLRLYNQQGSNNGQSDFGMNGGSASSCGAGQSWPSYDPNVYNNTYARPQESADSTETVPSYNKTNQSSDSANWAGFAGSNLQPFNHALQQNGAIQYSTEFYNNQNAAKGSQPLFTNGHHASYAPKETRSLTGRPPHALVTFGFGGKLLLMKNTSASGFSLNGSKDAEGHSLSVLNLMEVIGVNNGSPGTAASGSSYFQCLCYQSFPGPLVGGNAGSKEMNRWIDERIANCDSMSGCDGKGEAPKLLISLLKVAWQHYGKLRSFGTDAALKDNDLPESAVASLFAFAKGNNGQLGHNSVVAKCLIPLPSEAHIQAIASEVQNLLISGRKREALQRAQEGQLWGFALILARELGDQFYADTVKQMAVSQLVAGSPLRTLCLLIAKKPEEVFSINAVPAGNLSNSVAISPQPAHHVKQSAGYSMLANWEENLAVITANRTENDHLVITHLGDCLWKERNDVISAHICYLIAEADFELYSDTSRLCLIGADHWNFPRTYASPEAIQRTELFEYAKVTGNSQFVLLPLQPYKLIYAYMLAEVGRVSDSLKYCQAVLKVLKNGRSPEVDMLKQFSSSLEERIRAHQQSGYAANLAPGKIVGRLLNLFDSTAHRVVGGLPPPAPSNAMSNDHHNQSSGSKVRSSQSTMGMSSLMPSASMEPINQGAGDGSRRALHSRSASEPNIGRTPRAVDTSNGATSSSPDGKSSGTTGTSRFSRFSFGASIFQKTVGLVLKPRQGRQAKLGDTNKFYYNEKLKRWVEEGAEPPAEEPALAPPPTSAVFQTEKSDYYSNNAFNDGLSSSGGSLESASSAPPGSTIGIPAFPPSSNQFSARGRMNVRSRYVDTFNKGGATPTMFQAPSIPSSQPANVSSAKFFIPTATSPIQSTFSPESETGNDASGNEEQKSAMPGNVAFQKSTSSAAGTLQRFPSVDNISRRAMRSGNSSGGPQSRRTASWSAIPSDTYTSPPTAEVKASPLSFMPSNHSSGSLHNSGGSFGDDLHEVEF